MKTSQLLAAIGAATFLSAIPAHATLLFGPGEFLPGARVQNFDDSASYVTATPRVQIGASLGVDLGVTAFGGTLNFGPPFGAWSLGGNGEWTSAKTFAGVDGDFFDQPNGIAASLVFDFGFGRVREVGAFLNYDPDFQFALGPLQLYLAAYDSAGALIEDHFVPVDTPNAINAGAFFGIRTNGADIARFEVSAPFVVVDDLRFAVPAPSVPLLMLAGIAGFGLVRRRG
jgi:hypothetical protein